MDRVYKSDIPKTIAALEALREAFRQVAAPTDWASLRIDPLLEHARSLERVMNSKKFAKESSRLRRGVSMFRSDLVYLRENVKALRAELARLTKPRKL